MTPLARTRNRLIIALLIIMVAVAGAMTARYAWLKARPEAVAIAPTGGAPSPRFVLDDTPILRQTDPRWKESRLGGSGERFGSTGCAVCCVAMAMSGYGIPILPDSLNARLEAASGFTRQGWIKWEAITDITDGKISVETDIPLTHRAIDSLLRLHVPILAKVMIRGTISHWVLIVGKEGTEYLIKDPLGDGRKLDSLSSYGSNIYSIRGVRHTG